jgi:cell shape-determining protein MreC
MSALLRKRVEELAAENERLRAALEEIADWDSRWGPWPENNEAWRAMAVVTARQAVPRSKP